ncbi:unnamed protein product [Enterobius vermicularis]|uniref:Aldo_ket_red domain-containing protein n=1 Tax=Enterobius vermicularis TaxID=51028 RepID=A0A0N4VCY6_ENTVE|nr:unnamed protein product [Enterobius vermicularis]
MVVRGPTLKLSSGAEMPALGLGTWLSKPNEVGNAVRHALDCGYRLIDTAEAYGNEKEIGDALQEYFKAGKVKREDVFVTTKCFCNHFRLEQMNAAIRESLKKLQLDYVDLYLAHSPAALNEDNSIPEHPVTIEQIWQNLESVYKKGYAKAIGVSNFTVAQMERISKIATIPIHNLQVECYLYLPQFELAEFCKKHNITFTAYSPIGSPGRFSANVWVTNNLGVEWKHTPNPLEDELVKKLSGKYHKTAAQILLRYLLQRGFSPIPKSVNNKRIEENWNIFDFELSAAEMKELNELKKNYRTGSWDFLKGHPEDPFKNER